MLIGLAHKKWILSFLLLSAITSCRKSSYLIDREENITDQGGGTGTTTWTSDRDYLLNGFVFVNDGQVLTIEAGTVIRGKTGQGSLASALIVARGGTIIAEGTRDKPIIFTVEGDDLEGSVPLESRGLWGGLILLGNATINTESGEDMIEGIPVSEPRGIYGGNDDDDNSGILRYVSIQHGGTNIGEGNEINGLTLGGVGRQTIIEHVEVISNADDGIEFFGGDVNCRNLCVAFCGDDAYDLDQGYHGKGQFWLALLSGDSDHCFEVTGGNRSIPSLDGRFSHIYNATVIRDPGNVASMAGNFLSFGAGYIRNSIFLHPGEGIGAEYAATPGDSWSMFEAGRLALENNIFHPVSENRQMLFTYNEYGSRLDNENRIMADSLMAWKTDYNDPGISVTTDGYSLLPPRTEFENMAPYSNPWFEQVGYKGAFGSNLWIEDWTLLQRSGRILD